MAARLTPATDNTRVVACMEELMDENLEATSARGHAIGDAFGQPERGPDESARPVIGPLALAALCAPRYP
jgi:hypothetical protein